MKKRISLLLLLVGLTGFSASAQNYVLPTVTFDEAGAASQMEPGNKSIKGKAFIKTRLGTNVARKGDHLMLFPVSPYLLEYLELKKKNSRKKVATISDVAYTYRIEGKYLSDQGDFEFRDLKPGLYYIQTYIPVEKRRTVQRQTGEQGYINIYAGTWGTTPIYSSFWQHYSVDEEVGGVVEIKQDSDVVNILISK